MEIDAVLEKRRDLSVKYYKENRLSLGQCAELSEMSKANFIKYLSKQEISIFRFKSQDEILEDLKNA